MIKTKGCKRCEHMGFCCDDCSQISEEEATCTFGCGKVLGDSDFDNSCRQCE